MSRHQLTHQGDHANDDAGQAAKRHDGLPATAMVRQILASGHPDVSRIAQIVASNPSASHEIFTLLNQTMGNGFAREVLELATSRDVKMHDTSTTLGAPRDIATIDSFVGRDYEEARATIDHPHAAVDTPAYDDGGYQEARATIDHPHVEKKEAPWVERARRYNRAQPSNVKAFLDSTGNQCVDEAGELDPQKVARWQKDHGLSPDGRVGDDTVCAAVSDPSLLL